MTTSNTFDFPKIIAFNLIRDAFSQLGLNPSLVTGQQLQLAIQSLNLVLNSWISKKGVNLFTIEQEILALTPGQNVYKLPDNTSRILECVAISASPWLFPNGSSFFNTSLLSVALPCQVFIDQPITYKEPLQSLPPAINSSMNGPCYVAAINMTRLSNYPFIQYVGIQASVKNTYTLAIDYNIQTELGTITQNTILTDPNWQVLKQLPTLTYYAGAMRFFALPFQVQPLYIRVREANNKTISLQMIKFFAQDTLTPMTAIGRDTYMKMVTQTTQSSPSCYYVDRTSTPTISLYPTPNGTNYNFIVYNRTRMIQDVTDANQSLDISPRFIEAATTALAARLARLVAPDRLAALNSLADNLFNEAISEDTEKLPLQLNLTRGS